jgi:hypothetical protein
MAKVITSLSVDRNVVARVDARARLAGTSRSQLVNDYLYCRTGSGAGARQVRALAQRLAVAALSAGAGRRATRRPENANAF